MPSRRTVIGGSAVVGLTALAGCVDLEDLLGDALDGDADPAGIDAETLDELGFQHVETDDFTIEEEIDLGDDTVELSATNWVAKYATEQVNEDDLDEDTDPEDIEHLDAGDAIGAVVVTTPSAEFAGQEANPAGRLDTEDLVEEFEGAFFDGEVTEFVHLETRSVVILDESTDLSVYEATVEHDDADEPIPIVLYAASIKSGDDFVLPAGLHHRSIDAEERVLSLLEAIEHPVDEP